MRNCEFLTAESVAVCWKKRRHVSNRWQIIVRKWRGAWATAGNENKNACVLHV